MHTPASVFKHFSLCQRTSSTPFIIVDSSTSVTTHPLSMHISASVLSPFPLALCTQQEKWDDPLQHHVRLSTHSCRYSPVWPLSMQTSVSVFSHFSLSKTTSSTTMVDTPSPPPPPVSTHPSSMHTSSASVFSRFSSCKMTSSTPSTTMVDSSTSVSMDGDAARFMILAATVKIRWKKVTFVIE